MKKTPEEMIGELKNPIVKKNIFGTIIVIVIVALLVGLPVMWLWNWLMPVIFGLPTITYLQAYGLMLLSSFLFKSTK